MPLVWELLLDGGGLCGVREGSSRQAGMKGAGAFGGRAPGGLTSLTVVGQVRTVGATNDGSVPTDVYEQHCLEGL